MVSPQRVRRIFARGRGTHQFRGCVAGAILGRRPQVGVGTEGSCGRRVTECALHGDDVAAGRDEACGVEVA